MEVFSQYANFSFFLIHVQGPCCQENVFHGGENFLGKCIGMIISNVIHDLCPYPQNNNFLWNPLFQKENASSESSTLDV